MSVAARKLGEMVVVGTIPARLVAPLEFLGNNLHSTLDDGKGRHAGWSRVACIATSLIVRDFLTALHIRADVRSVAAYAFATLNGTKYPERALGAPSDRIEPNQWQGHIVVVAEGVLIDTTLRGLDTPGVSSLPRMIALPATPTQRHFEVAEFQVKATLSIAVPLVVVGSAMVLASKDDPQVMARLAVPVISISRPSP